MGSTGLLLAHFYNEALLIRETRVPRLLWQLVWLETKGRNRTGHYMSSLLAVS